MTQWKEIRLGDHLSFITSGSRGWSEYYASDGALFLRIQNVGYNELRLEDIAFVQPPDGAEARRTRVQPGDVLLSITADLGRTAVVPEGLGTAHINQHLAILRVKDIDPHYLAAFLSLGPGRLQLKRLDRVGVKSGLNFDDLRSLRILLPLLPEQRRIVVILDKADTIRRKRAEAIRLADDLLKSAFLDMFGDPVTNPKKWAMMSLLDVLQFTTGKLDSNAAEINGMYPFFTCSRETFAINEYAFDCEALLLAGNNASGEYSVKHHTGKFNAYQRTYVITQ